MKSARHLLLCVLVVSACSRADSDLSSDQDISAIRANLAFECRHEATSLPPLDADADLLFQYARYLQKAKGPKDYAEMTRHYRIAAAHGHYKANNNLQLMLSYGEAKSPNAAKETVDLAEQQINEGIPGGYYSMGHYLETGWGVKRDPKLALQYFRKAADLGNPDGQYYVAELLSPWDKAPEIAQQMYECAAGQGFSEAANGLGITLKIRKQYPDAMRFFQMGVKAGNISSASFLQHGFNGPPPAEELNYRSAEFDPERVRRYKAIGDLLTKYEHLNPKVPDIDQIVPLPPAKLPPWDGTFQWKREHDAAVPPPKPSEELVIRLSKAKNLDPATGLPLGVSLNDPTKRDADRDRKRTPLGSEIDSGQRCPESGVWCIRSGIGSLMAESRAFKAGEVMPELSGTRPRRFRWMDDLLGLRTYSIAVTWELIEYPKNS